MKILFIHQNFPGQYLYLVQYLRRAGHKITGIGEDANIKKRGVIRGCTTIGYPSPQKAGPDTHHYLRGLEACVRRGQAVARTLIKLRDRGFVPDVISLHPGWGEGLFVREIFPRTPLIMFCEYYFRAGQADVGFDPEFPADPDWIFSINLRNTAQIMSLLSADCCLCPTEWQASRYPAFIRDNMRIIHDGINTDFMTPDPEERIVLQPLKKPGHSRILDRLKSAPPQGEEKVGDAGEREPAGKPLRLSRADKVITYAARNLEPYRGIHAFLRSLPELQKRHPDAHVVIAGNDGTSYSRTPPGGCSYKDIYLGEISGKVDLSRIHFLGRIAYPSLRALFRVTTAHVYLTYPFVLSWSCLEAMSCGALTVASDTGPVPEVITHGDNGLLVDFFDREKLLATLNDILENPCAFDAIRSRARNSVVGKYRLDNCLGQQLSLLEDAVGGRLGSRTGT
ncbi:MAG: glycosyltransferase [Desulfovibrio sp.]|jgi:glycosyltransferase involved in cell wall biosynthesis|nr:glycosyltransferase [Desulfovibrio sp.]